VAAVASQAAAAVGFRVHTGWASLIAVAGAALCPTVVDRRRLEMIAGNDPEAPPYVYHAAAKLPLAAAERFVREHTQAARESARAAVADAVTALREHGYEVIVAGVIVGNRPFLAPPLASIVKAHSLIHAAEGELFRQAIVEATEACRLSVTCIPAQQLYARSAADLKLSSEALLELLATVGRAAGKPWAHDQKESLLAALVARKARRH
jgi:hypothetical protein